MTPRRVPRSRSPRAVHALDSRSKQAVAVAESVAERARRNLKALSKAERRVAHALLEDYPVAGLETVAQFAERAGTSGPTILRFVGHLGFTSYNDFQKALRSELQLRLQGPLARYGSRPRSDEDGDPFKRLGSAICRNIQHAVGGVSRREYAVLSALISDRRRAVFCLGGRFSQLIAAYFHHYLRWLRPGTRLIRDGSATWADYLLDVRSGDVLVVFDFRRYQRDVLQFAGSAAAQGAVIVLFTDVWNSPIAKYAAHVIRCPVEVPTAFDSGVAGLAMVEVIIASVVEELGNRSKIRMERLERLRAPFRLHDPLTSDPQSDDPDRSVERRGR
jgi:DNA-binding MurR/RpiR family transcriptional regulator